MESPLCIRVTVTLFCTTLFLSLTSSQQTAQYFFYQSSEYPKDCRDVQRQCSISNSSGVYLIKPDGFQEPFEVFCDNDVTTGGWTVIQRRESGFVNFNRNWLEYKNGFGFLSTEFWIGNEKLSYLTNQAVYELLTEVELLDGSFFYTSYKGFRISDEFGEYKLQHINNVESNGSSVISDCPAKVYFNDDCSQICSCDDSGLECSAVQCDANAACIESSTGVWNCSCNDGYDGNGINCTAPTTSPPLYTDCKDIYDSGQTASGVYTILPDRWPHAPFNVYCEMGHGGGWTVFQRRRDDTVDFYQNWAAYKNGFGDPNGNVWLGNEKLYYLTNQRNYKLRLDITTSSGTSYYSEFPEFQIESEDSNYRMNKLGSRSSPGGGYAGSNLNSNKGKQFSTYDRDNDQCGRHNCAEKHRSGWWHFAISCSSCVSDTCSYFRYSSSCNTRCTGENLNGDYNGGNGEVVFSGGSRACNPTFVEMKIRPSS